MNATLTPAATDARECSRCQGTGNVNLRRTGALTTNYEHKGIPGTCFDCDGKGVATGWRAARQVAAEREEAARATEVAAPKPSDFRELYACWGPFEDRHAGTPVMAAALLLWEREPARFDKLTTSIMLGHPGVVPALLAYLEAAR